MSKKRALKAAIRMAWSDNKRRQQELEAMQETMLSAVKILEQITFKDTNDDPAGVYEDILQVDQMLSEWLPETQPPQSQTPHLADAMECRSKASGMTDTSKVAVDKLLVPLQEYLKLVNEENARLQYIKAAIRVNATRQGATSEQIEAFVSGEASFIDWMVDNISGPQSALAAERDALQAQLDATLAQWDQEIKGWESCYDKERDRANAAEQAAATARACLIDVKAHIVDFLDDDGPTLALEMAMEDIDRINHPAPAPAEKGEPSE